MDISTDAADSFLSRIFFESGLINPKQLGLHQQNVENLLTDPTRIEELQRQLDSFYHKLAQQEVVELGAQRHHLQIIQETAERVKEIGLLMDTTEFEGLTERYRGELQVEQIQLIGYLREYSPLEVQYSLENKELVSSISLVPNEEQYSIESIVHNLKGLREKIGWSAMGIHLPEGLKKQMEIQYLLVNDRLSTESVMDLFELLLLELNPMDTSNLAGPHRIEPFAVVGLLERPDRDRFLNPED